MSVKDMIAPVWTDISIDSCVGTFQALYMVWRQKRIIFTTAQILSKEPSKPLNSLGSDFRRQGTLGI